MPVSKFERFLPIAGVLAGILFAVNGFVGSTSEVADPNGVQAMTEHATRNLVAGLAGGLCCVALLFFVGAVRSTLRSGETGEATYSSVAFAGGILLAFTKAVDGWLLIAAGDAAAAGDKASLRALGYLGLDSWVPWVAVSAVFFLATGLGGLAHGSLPKWLSIATVVLGVLCLLGPTGIAVWFATPVWLVVTGVVLSRRQSSMLEISVPTRPARV